MRTNSGILNAFRIAIATMAALVLSTHDLSSQDKAAIYKPLMEAAKDSLPKVRSASGTVQIPQVYSPNAASLATFGKIPADLYHGLANVSIPLDSVVAKGYTLPIYLTYNTKGNRPEIHPGWVGQNWTLHAGGCITRIVNDMPDEILEEEFRTYYLSQSEQNNSQCYVSEPGYFYHCDENQRSDWKNSAVLHSGLGVPRVDLSPDEFQICIDDINASFYVKGRQGSDYDIAIVSRSGGSFKVQFIMDMNIDRNRKLYPDNSGISYNTITSYPHIKQINVIKDDGTRYIFGAEENSREYSYTCPYAGENDKYLNSVREHLNTWYLSRIELPNGEIVRFEYETQGVPVVKSDNWCNWTMIINSPDEYTWDSFTPEANIGGINFTFLKPCYLKRISCELSEDNLTFTRTRSNELGYDITSEQLWNRGIRFPRYDFDRMMSYDYYMKLSNVTGPDHGLTLTYSNSEVKRLHLKSVCFNDSEGVERKYTMSYNAIHLPPYNSKKTDAWGYYNGKNYNGIRDSCINRYRIVNPDSVKAEILDTLYYPTGGYTAFDYESNSYSVDANPYIPISEREKSGLGDGLRIKSLTDFDGMTSRTRTFRYEDADSISYGIISCIPKFWSSEDVHINDETIKYTIFDENKIDQIPAENGSFVTYRLAEELMPDGSRIETEYWSSIDHPDEVPQGFSTNFCNVDWANPVTSKALSRGVPKSVRYYDAEDRMVRSEDMDYNCDTSMVIWNIQYFHLGRFARVSNPRLYYYQPYLTSRTIAEYSTSESGDPYVLTESNVYDDTLRLPRTSSRTVGDRTETTRVTYPSDLTTSSFYNAMSSAGFKAFPIEVRSSVNGQLVGSELTTYKKNALNNDYVVDAVYTSKLTSAVNESDVPTFTGGIVDPVYGEADLKFGKYDNHSNPLSASGRTIPGRKYYWKEGQNRPSAIFEGVPWSFEIQDTLDIVKTADVTLDSNDLQRYSKTFTCISNGNVEFSVFAMPGYNWSVTVRIDNQAYNIASINATGTSDTFWTQTAAGYPSSMSIPVSPGTHTVIMSNARWFKNANAQEALSLFTLSYPQVEERSYNCSADQVYYSGVTVSEPHTVTLDNVSVTNHIDYKVLRNGQWEYVHDTFTGTSYTISEGNNPVKEIRAYPKNCLVNSYEYDIRGHLISATNPMGATTHYTYDGFGRLTGMKDNSGSLVSSYEYSYATAQNASADGNCVTVKTYDVVNGSPSNAGTYTETKTIFDGLGREIRQVGVGASPENVNDSSDLKKDIVNTIEYDANGRPDKTWLPVAYANASTADLGSIQLASASFYYDARPFSQTLYNAYPYSTITTEYGPGEQWYNAGRKMQTDFLTNSESYDDVLACLKFSATSSSSVASPTVTVAKSGLRASGTLTVARTMNEDNQTAYEFKDMDGNVVLQRVMTGASSWNDTYYVYDSLNRLAAVLQPSLSASFSSITSLTSEDQQMKDYAFLYVYDKYGQAIAKRIPGAGWERFAYDKQGARVCSQTAAQAENNEVSFCLYDNLFRECIIGQFNGNLPEIDGTEVVAMPADAVGQETVFGYCISNLNLPSDTKYLTVNHYDNYGFLGANGFPVSGDSLVVKDTQPLTGSYGAVSSCTAMGLLTGTINAVLGNSSEDKALWKVNYYDDRARVIQQRSNSHLDNRYETSSTCYDFIGNVTKNTLWHDNGQSRSTEVYNYTYDKWQRPLTTTHSRDGAAAVILAENSYDAIGRLVSTARANNASLATNVGYNIRSWVTSYGGPVFNETIKYVDGAVPQYGGNTSTIQWRRGANGAMSTYDFTYDAIGRLVGAASSGNAAGHNETYAYDRQYNMTSATRNGVTTQFGYSGNRQTSIGSYTCTYDSDGRQITNGSVNLMGTTYNEIGLPKVRTYSSGSSLPNVYTTAYSSDGTKLSATTIKNRVVSEKNYVGNLVLDGTSLDKTLIEGGYIDSQNRYHFLLKDHLGNVRADALVDGTIVNTYDYYPYGDTFSSTSPTAGQPYRFSGNEIDPFGTYDFIARQYAPSTGRFTTIDPLAEKYYGISPYAYCAGNPVNLVDPEGMDARITRDGNTITISAVIYIYGAGSSEYLAEIYQQSIYDNWGKFTKITIDNKTYNVIWDINVQYAEEKMPFLYDGVSNYVEVDAKTNRSKVKNLNQGYFKPGIGGDNPMPHEFGHMLGLRDRYTEYERGICIHMEDYLGNIMAEPTGMGVPYDQNMTDLIEPFKYVLFGYGYYNNKSILYINRSFREQELKQ